jgi:hypothetical protein
VRVLKRKAGMNERRRNTLTIEVMALITVVSVVFGVYQILTTKKRNDRYQIGSFTDRSNQSGAGFLRVYSAAVERG